MCSRANFDRTLHFESFHYLWRHGAHCIKHEFVTEDSLSEKAFWSIIPPQYKTFSAIISNAVDKKAVLECCLISTQASERMLTVTSHESIRGRSPARTNLATLTGANDPTSCFRKPGNAETSRPLQSRAL
jgi:hypothetical protein